VNVGPVRGAGRANGGSSWRGLALLALGLLPILAWVHLTFVAPRPFFIAEYDAEHLTYYSALLLNAGRAPLDLHNPGFVVDYVAAAFMALQATGIDNPQALLAAGHLFTAILTGLSLVVVARFLLKRLPPGAAALALAPMLAWPSFLVFFEYFDPIGLQAVVGLPTIAIFWSSLELDGRARLRRLLMSGLALGVCLATKLTFLPVAAAMFATTLTSVGRRDGSIRDRVAPILMLSAGAIAAFVLLAVPLLGEVPARTLLPLLHSDDIRPPWWQPLDVLSGWKALIAASWPSAVLVIAAAATFVFQLARGRQRARPGLPHASQAALFLTLMLIFLVYTMASDGGEGSQLRNSYPSALCVPFLVIYGLGWSGARERRRGLMSRPLVQGAIVVLAVAIVARPVFLRAEARRTFIESRTRLIKDTRDRLAILQRPGGRLAVWDGSPGTRLGEESFHYWGNYKYAGNAFDEMLAQRYPETTFFRLREVRPILSGAYAADPAAAASSAARPAPGSAFGWPGRAWRWLFPHENPAAGRPDALVADEASGTGVSLIAFPADEGTEELAGVSEAALLSLVQQRFGPASLRRETIAGVEWVLISIAR
jgi:hypothetical protein